VRIVLAAESDVERIMKLVRECVKDMVSHGIYQWNDYYPNADIIRGDVRSKSMHVVEENDEIIGMIALNEEQAAEYVTVRWSRQSDRVLVIHRLAVNPTKQNQGIGGKLLDYAEKFAIDNGYESIRLDSYSGNPKALRLYEKHGYRRVGQVNFPRRELPFYCFEKIMKGK
jgi:ribosomal protein S18 acetylase RimI-like enzyme